MQISEKQQAIIEASGKILTSFGTSGFTIKKLASAMQFSESAIYRHFKSKEEIIITMLTFLAENIDQRLSQNYISNQNSQTKFVQLFQNQFIFFKANPHFLVALFSDGLREESTKINEAILNLMRIKIKHLKPIIIEGQNKGLFKNTISADDITHIAMGTFRLQMYKWRIANFKFDIETQGNKTIQSLLTIIK
ncbi:TetR/AcrR family transcriptional regulator [Flavobacterium psychrophilum]|nr:TetR/AcrR family transcriptional regulator [Flavobacterium psychrophilum]